MGDYFMDIDHGKTAHAVEADLDVAQEVPRGGGPFQVPFEVFVPEKINGLVFAEKNISQSRIVNGATRLQPITILTGQAAGAIAALAALENPREVNPSSGGAAQGGSNSCSVGMTMCRGAPLWVPRSPTSTACWMPGPFNLKDELPWAEEPWRPEEPLMTGVFATKRLKELSGTASRPSRRIHDAGRVAWRRGSAHPIGTAGDQRQDVQSRNRRPENPGRGALLGGTLHAAGEQADKPSCRDSGRPQRRIPQAVDAVYFDKPLPIRCQETGDPPDDYNPEKRYRVLYILPVGADPGANFAQRSHLDIANRHDLILVEMTFEKVPGMETIRRIPCGRKAT